jgi:hypothetical protein
LRRYNKGTSLGLHTTEEAAALAYNTEAERIGLVNVNVIGNGNGIPPAGDADDGDNAVALALLGRAAHVDTMKNRVEGTHGFSALNQNMVGC